MFAIHNKTDNGFDIVILKDESNGTFAEIIPSCAAILHKFVCVISAENCNVIESYKSLEDFKSHVTSKGFLGTKLSPFVCRINKGKYNFEGREFTIQKYYDRKNALHGMLYDQPFRIIKQEANDGYSSVTMKHEYRAMDPGYPFNYDCTITYKLEQDSKLNVVTTIINKDEVVIPVQDGWHPYFTLHEKIDDLELQFQSKEMVEFNDELIPTGKLIPYTQFNSLKKFGDTFFDNCFTLDFNAQQPMCLLRNTKRNIQVEIYPEESYPYLQFYTPSHRNSIAIENISGAPDAFNNGMGFKRVAPGEKVSFTTSYKITLLP